MILFFKKKIGKDREIVNCLFIFVKRYCCELYIYEN